MAKGRKAPATLGHLLLVTLLGIPLLTPLWRWTTNPCTHDGHLHIHRVATIRHAWENGILFSRWLPDLAFGYGYPFFIYREPGPLYAVLLPHLLGIPLPAASNLFYALTILASGWFMFLWVKDLLGARAGIVSAVAYMAAPYILIDALVRGNAPESLALPLFPFLLWIGRRWIIKGSAWTFLAAVLGLALLSLSHNISTLIFTPILLLYLVVIGWLHKLSWKALLVRLILFFGLGLGMTFFYTGGALLEMDQVTLSQSTTTRNNDFHFNFATIGEILAPLSPKDPDLLNPPLPIRLGWVPLSLALLGVSTLFWRKNQSRERQAHIIMMAAGAALFLFMALPFSLFIWENVPLIDFIQFPWRFVGRAALPIAFLAGVPFAALNKLPEGSRKWLRLLWHTALVAVVGLLIFAAIPALYPRQCPEILFPSINDVHAYERGSGLVGIDPEGSYFPKTVGRRPDGSPLEADYLAGETPRRFDVTALPAGATADVRYDRLGAAININTPEPFTARYFSFAFPGWEVAVNGQPVTITPSEPDGLITFDLPAGSNSVTISWESTPLRTALTIISLLSLLGVIITTIWLLIKGPLSEQSPVQQEGIIAEFWPLLILSAAILALQFLLINQGWTPLLRPNGPAVDYPLVLQAQEQQLAGFNLSQDPAAAGGSFDIDLAWTTVAPTGNEYQSNVWLAGPQGQIWSAKETYRPRIYEDSPPTWEREAGQWVWDSREVQVLPGTPPGEYDIVLTYFDLETLEPLTLISEDGSVAGPTAVIGQISVSMPRGTQPFKPQYSKNVQMFDGDLILLGFNQDRETAVPGEELLLTLFWQKAGDPLRDTISFKLVDDSGSTAHDWEVALSRPDFESSNWQPGQLLRGQYGLRLPASVDTGLYQITLGNNIPLGNLQIIAPTHTFEQPPLENLLEIPFGTSALLTGYNISLDDSADLVVDLIWQAQEEMDVPYHVFIHLVDESGQIINQSDSQPAHWSRPTTGWAPGEYILDSHTIPISPDLPLDSFSLRTGLYDPATGERLMAGDSDFVTIPLE